MNIPLLTSSVPNTVTSPRLYASSPMDRASSTNDVQADVDGVAVARGCTLTVARKMPWRRNYWFSRSIQGQPARASG